MTINFILLIAACITFLLVLAATTRPGLDQPCGAVGLFLWTLSLILGPIALR